MSHPLKDVIEGLELAEVERQEMAARIGRGLLAAYQRHVRVIPRLKRAIIRVCKVRDGAIAEAKAYRAAAHDPSAAPKPEPDAGEGPASPLPDDCDDKWYVAEAYMSCGEQPEPVESMIISEGGDTIGEAVDEGTADRISEAHNAALAKVVAERDMARETAANSFSGEMAAVAERDRLAEELKRVQAIVGIRRVDVLRRAESAEAERDRLAELSATMQRRAQSAEADLAAARVLIDEANGATARAVIQRNEARERVGELEEERDAAVGSSNTWEQLASERQADLAAALKLHAEAEASLDGCREELRVAENERDSAAADYLALQEHHEATRAEGGRVPECVERWRNTCPPDMQKVDDVLREYYHGSAQEVYKWARQCLEYLAIQPPPAAEGAAVVARDGDVEVLREWQKHQQSHNCGIDCGGDALEALSRARIYRASVVKELVAAAKAEPKALAMTMRLRKPLAAMSGEGS
jgi:hypothetical protein